MPLTSDTREKSRDQAVYAPFTVDQLNIIVCTIADLVAKDLIDERELLGMITSIAEIDLKAGTEIGPLLVEAVFQREPWMRQAISAWPNDESEIAELRFPRPPPAALRRLAFMWQFDRQNISKAVGPWCDLPDTVPVARKMAWLIQFLTSVAFDLIATAMTEGTGTEAVKTALAGAADRLLRRERWPAHWAGHATSAAWMAGTDRFESYRTALRQKIWSLARGSDTYDAIMGAARTVHDRFAAPMSEENLKLAVWRICRAAGNSGGARRGRRG